MEKPRALITGISGFTGRYVAQDLAGAGWQVFGFGAQAAPKDAYRQVDLEDAVELAKAVEDVRPDAVFHLAAISFVGHGDASDFYRINLIGTRNLLAALAASQHRPRSVLLASSANVYGNATEGVLHETTPPNPANDYAVSKLAMEHMARLWLDRLPIVIARPFNYTGIGQSPTFLLPKIVDHFRRGQKRIELGNLDVFRDFSDVRAVANAYRRLVEISPAGQIVNICSGRSHSLAEVLAMMERIAGYRMEVAVNPAFVRPNEVRMLLGSSERLRNIIGNWNTPPLEETLEWMYQSGST